MLETPHVIVGAAIASKISNPVLSLPLVLASHFLLDRVPHWNPHLNTELKTNGEISKNSKKIIAVDVLCALAAGSAISYLKLPDYSQFMHVMIASFVAVSPDIVEGPYFFMNVRNKAIEKWIKIQKAIQSDAPPIAGLLTQLVTAVAAVWWIIN